MTRKRLYLLLPILILSLAAPRAYGAFQSLYISTICASVSFSGDPVIAHSAITQLAQGNYALISGTASTPTSADFVSGIFINYYVSGETGFSTATVSVGPSVKEQYFSTSVPVNMDGNPEYFYYRIRAADSAGRTAYWPAGGDFQPLYIALPPAVPLQIAHTPIRFISSIEKLFVATGTVTGGGIASVSMYYRPDNAVSYSTYTIMTADRPSSYDFRFQLDKNDVNFALAKYFYYYIRASDGSGTYAYAPSSHSVYTAEVIRQKTIEIGHSGGTVTIPNGNPFDGQTCILLPEGAVSGTTEITIAQVDPADSSVPPGEPPCASEKPVAVFNFLPEKLVFNKFAVIKLNFSDTDRDGIVDGTAYRTDTLRIFWWDGFDWRLLGGKKDPDLNLVAYDKIKHFSTYALFPVNALSNDDYRPREKIITPATADNKNDYAIFDGLVDSDIVNIYDVTGKRVRQLSENFSWDGKDDDGAMVESGIYIYQIKFAENGKIVSGTLVVAK